MPKLVLFMVIDGFPQDQFVKYYDQYADRGFKLFLDKGAWYGNNHYSHATIYGAGSHTFAKDLIGTRYMLAAVRTLANPFDEKDLAEAHALQTNIGVLQHATGAYEVPSWDPGGLARVRGALTVLGETITDSKRTFGMRGQVDPVRHLIATATAWGGNPEKDATYLTVTPARNDGETVYRLNVDLVPGAMHECPVDVEHEAADVVKSHGATRRGRRPSALGAP